VGRLFFINRFYWPEEPATAQLLTDLAEALAARGHAVTVIASRPAGAPPEETRNGVRIVRVGPGRHPGRGAGAKAVNFAAFFAAAFARVVRLTRRGDAIVALTDPPLIGLGAALAARIRGARLYHWTQDIYPEIALALTGHGWLRALIPWRDAAWRQADGCVTLGRDMAEALTVAGVAPDRVQIVPNWAPAGVGPADPAQSEALRAAWGLEGKFVVAYSGNLGRVHDLEPVLGAAELLRGEREVVFAFFGEGAGRPPLEAEARRRGLDQVRFFPSQPRALLSAALAAGDIHLVSLRADCARFVFPSKLYGIAAAGRPVIFVGPPDCEPARLVAEQGFGWPFANGEMPALAARVQALRDDPAERARAGAAALRFAAQNGGAEKAADAWDLLLGPGPAK
jgi:glycosyltransferase involved in cell wall biosynthesis